MHPKLKWKTLICLVAAAGLIALVTTSVTAQAPVPKAEDNAPGFNWVDSQLPRAKPVPRSFPVTHTEPIPGAQSRYTYILAPVGPEIIFDQADQDCAGGYFVDSFASSMGFLRNVEPPGAIGADYWNADGVEPTPAFICTGAQNMYWLDQVYADGSAMNGIDLKYWTTVNDPPCADGYIRVHFRSRTVLPAVGTEITNPPEYVMGPMPINIHPAPHPDEQTNYFIRMSTPSAGDIALGLKPGYLVAELVDEAEPVDLSYSNLVEGSQVEVWEAGWLPTTTIRGSSFGVATSFNLGWNNDGDSSDDDTMGWFLSGRDLQVLDQTLDGFTWLDKDKAQWTDPVSGGVIGSYYYGGTACAPDEPDPSPEASVYTILWAKEFGLPEPNDQFNWNGDTLQWEGMADTGLTGVKQSCLITPGRIDAHPGDLLQPAVTDPFLDVDIYRVNLQSRGPINIGGQQYCRTPLLRADIDTDQPIDLMIRLWDSTKQELLLADTLRHQDGTFASTDPTYVEGDVHFGEDVLVPSLDPLLVFDDMFCDLGSTVIISDDYFFGVSWEQNADYDPSAAGSGTVVGDPDTQGEEIGAYYMRIAVGHYTRKAGALTVVDDIDDQIDRATELVWVSPGSYESPAGVNLGGNHVFRGHDLDSTDPLLGPSCVGDVDIYHVPDSEEADGYGIKARVQATAVGGNNMAIGIYKWDGVGTPELVAVGDDINVLLADTDPIAYTKISNDPVNDWYVAVLGVGVWDSGAAGDFWYALNAFVDTLPIDIEIQGTEDTNTGGQGPYELLVDIGPHSDVPFSQAPSQPWEPNDSIAEADANGYLPNQLGTGDLNGLPTGEIRAQYLSINDPAIGGEPQNTGIYMGDGVHGESATVDQGGDVDIYKFGANEGEIVEINVDVTSTQTPVNPNRNLISRCYLFDHERTLLDNPDLYIGQYRTIDGCNGFRNMSTTLQHQIPRTGTYYAVVVGADTRKPFHGAQVPYDLSKDGTIVGGLVEYDIGVYCSPASHTGLYNLGVTLMAAPPCPKNPAGVGQQLAPLLIYVNRRAGAVILDVNPVDFTVQAGYNLPPETTDTFPTDTQTAAAITNGVEPRLGEHCDRAQYNDTPPGPAAPPAIAPPAQGGDGQRVWLNPDTEPGGWLEDARLVLYFHRSENSNQTVGSEDMNRMDDITWEKVYMLYPDSPDANMPILGTFNYDPADWAYNTVASGNLLLAKTWAVGTYHGMAVQEACYWFVLDGGNGLSESTVAGDDVLWDPPQGGVGGIVVDPGPDGVIDVGTQIGGDDLEPALDCREYLYVIDRAVYDNDQDGQVTPDIDGFGAWSVCQVELETGCIVQCWKLPVVNPQWAHGMQDADGDGSLFLGCMGEATLRDWDGPGLDRKVLSLELDDGFLIVFVDSRNMQEVTGSAIDPESQENIGGMTSLTCQNLAGDCRTPCPRQPDNPHAAPCIVEDNHDILYVGQTNNGLDMTYNVDAPAPRTAAESYTGSVITNRLNVAYAGILLGDADGDNIGDELDNCVLEPNYDQRDTNSDGIGDACSENLARNSDYYITDEAAKLLANYVDFANWDGQIPAGFFFSGSPAYNGRIDLEGLALNQEPDAELPMGHNASIIIARTDDAWIYDGGDTDPGFTLPQSSAWIPAAVDEMHLVSLADITIVDSSVGGPYNTTWSLDLTESSGGQWVGDPGNMQFTRTSAEGGTFELFLLLVGDYTFTCTDDGGSPNCSPGDQVVLEQRLVGGGAAPDGTDMTQLWNSATGVWVDEIDDRGGAAFKACIYFPACEDVFYPDQYAHASYCPFVGVEYTPLAGEYDSDFTRGVNTMVEVEDWTADPPVVDATPRQGLRFERAYVDADDDGAYDAGCEPPAEGCVCGDIDESGGQVNLGDFATFAVCYGLVSPNPPGCDAAAFACSDMDGDTTVDLGDFASFAAFYGLNTTFTVPNCVLP